FSRIQFTPDLMPNDITGTDIIEEDVETRHRYFKFIKGPIFGNIILADEINRTPPKTQAALLQAMQEYQVTSGGKTFDLDLPFFVLATQNPIEQEGTYPLPEAQLDRFMFSLILDYPSEAEELEIVKRTTIDKETDVACVLTKQEIISLQSMVRKVPVSDEIYKYAVSIVRKSRPGEKDCHPDVKDWLQWGAGPRASQNIIIGAKSRAVLMGREGVSEEDIRKIAYPVLQHRLITNFNAEASGITTRKIIDTILNKT
ncbi:AAA family ATPase, partial [bacterium]|nr:AAA family ATPase [bacterium]